MSTLKHVDFEVPSWGELAQGPQLWQAYHQAVLDLNPLGYWRLGEAGGITAVDQQNVRDGTYQPNDGSAWTGGTLGEAGALFRDVNTAASFDSAAPGWIELPFIALPAQFTLVAWLKSSVTAAGAGNTIFSWGQDDGLGDAVEIRLFEVAGGEAVLQFQVKDQGGLQAVQGSTNLRDAGWHHIAVSYYGTTATLYADAQFENSGTIDADPLLHHTQIGLLRRGFSNLANPVNARLDDIALFDQVLTANEIADLCRRGTGWFKPAP